MAVANSFSEIINTAELMLNAIHANDGLVGNKFIVKEAETFKYETIYSIDAINAACIAVLGSKKLEGGRASDNEMAKIVEQLKSRNASLLRAISEMRAAKGK
jgi:hypothetical protein